ncbi:hypothetical protein RhiirA4_469025 [Rhizophagus irregularis]|uniref:Uncharacterized protein n=1 Tax=Rhizophagus irregularis TaxID=588596 RepID=A0A2I1GYT8_9GLOM|nr:hypothetical protein RhiirA4_469025 [Rhizophagus irregularis]
MSDIYGVLEKKVKELEKVKEKGEKLLDVIVVSIRYKNEPDYKKIGIISVIKIICEHYILDEEDNLLVEEKEAKENLLGNKERTPNNTDTTHI